MHEMSIAMSVVEMAEEYAKKHNAAKILSVTVDIGDLAGVMTDALAFCFEACARGSIAEGGAIYVNRIEALAHCPSCGIEFSPENSFIICPQCSGPCGILRGEELQVRSVEAL